MITKSVEFAHRVAGAQARPKGPAKAVEFRIIADGFVLNRLAVLHNEAIGRKRKARPRIKDHPRVQEMIHRVRKQHIKASAGPSCSNPKMVWLNARRQELRALKLPKDQFYARVSAYARSYDNDEVVRLAARDFFRVHRQKMLISRASASAAQGEQQARRVHRQKMLNPVMRVTGSGLEGQYGPWQLGDKLWPLSEDHLNRFVTEGSAAGGLRKLVAAHRQQQEKDLILTSARATSSAQLAPTAAFQDSCAQKHPGKCRSRLLLQGRLVARAADCIADGLHSIRFSKGSYNFNGCD